MQEKLEFFFGCVGSCEYVLPSVKATTKTLAKIWCVVFDV